MLLTLVLVSGLVVSNQHLSHSLQAERYAGEQLSNRLSTLERHLLQGDQAVAALGTRLSSLEAASRAEVDPADIAEKALESVFTIDVRSGLGEALGSAWVASTEGEVSTLVTNFHVVELAWATGIREVSVRQGDLTYPGTIVKVNQADDLAAIRVAIALPPLDIDRAKPSIGDQLIVIGSPFGLEGTVATGIVSAFRGSLMQFSAPVSPGDSGGPILNDQGHVVAITVAKIAAANAEGLSFGIPVRTACRTVIAC